jgi:putative ABC transport system permease protein
VLLVSGGLIVRGVQQASVQDPGFDMKDVSVVSFELPASFETARTRSFGLQLLSNLPSVVSGRAFGFADIGPFMPADRMWTAARVPGATMSRADDALVLEVSGGYFEALGIPIVAGRNFEASDTKRDVILISESMARRLWPDGPAVGRILELADTAKQSSSQTGDRHVVGVVKDVNTYYGNVTTAFATVYAPIAGRTMPRLIVRHLDPGLTQAIAAFAKRIEPRSRLVVTSVSANRDRRLAPSMVAAWTAGMLGLLAAVLAGIGVFSMFAYAVEQRTSEVGIRLALGARPTQIVWSLLASNSGSVALGVVLGVAGALVASQVIRNQLHGLSPFDAIAYLGVAAVLTIIAIAATIVPARRAIRIDPIVALRCE